jgi:hypothetical protein
LVVQLHIRKWGEERKGCASWFFPEENNHPQRIKSTQMKVDYIVLIQLILYSLGLSCLELLGFEDASRHSWKSRNNTKRDRERKGHQVKLTLANE